MDLTKDRLYTSDPSQAPACRWMVNVNQCQGSSYFRSILYISISLSSIALVLGLFYLLVSKNRNLAPPPWSGTRLCIVGILLSCTFLISHSVLLLIDPPTSYWARQLLFSLTYLITHAATTPYLRNLISNKFLLLTNATSLAAHRRHQYSYLVFAIPLMLLLSTIIMVMGALSIDLQNPLPSDVLYRLGTGMYAISSIPVAWISWVYGYQFSQDLREQILDIEAASRPPVSSVFSSPYPSFSSSSSQSRLGGDHHRQSIIPVVSLPSPPKPTVNRLSHSTASVMWRSASFSTSRYDAIEPPLQTKPTSSTVEAKAILCKMRTFHLFLVWGSLLGILSCLVHVAINEDLYRLTILSKIVFLGPMILCPLYYLYVIITSLTIDYLKRKTHRKLQSLENKPYQMDDQAILEEALIKRMRTRPSLARRFSMDSMDFDGGGARMA